MARTPGSPSGMGGGKTHKTYLPLIIKSTANPVVPSGWSGGAPRTPAPTKPGRRTGANPPQSTHYNPLTPGKGRSTNPVQPPGKKK